jgi:hypothetical protein
MEPEYIKLASYYIVFNDETGGCSVRFYGRDGDQLKHLYFTWDEKQDTNFNKMLDSKLDQFHKWKLRPKIIKIYESNLGRTIGYYDKNDNLVFHTRYDGGSKLDEILSWKHNAPIDIDYLSQTKKVILIDDFDNPFRRYSKIVASYWNRISNLF